MPTPERVLQIGTREHTEVACLDEPGPGGANHEYEIRAAGNVFTGISFQNGPVKESGVNGIHNEDLLAIVIDRMQGFQRGEYTCRENALAITKLEEAMMWLRKRTDERAQGSWCRRHQREVAEKMIGKGGTGGEYVGTTRAMLSEKAGSIPVPSRQDKTPDAGFTGG